MGLLKRNISKMVIYSGTDHVTEKRQDGIPFFCDESLNIKTHCDNNPHGISII